MSAFTVGQRVRLDAPHAPAFHGRLGTVIALPGARHSNYDLRVHVDGRGEQNVSPKYLTVAVPEFASLEEADAWLEANA